MIDWSRIRHFSPGEFGEGEPGVEIDKTLVEMLDAAREIAGTPFRINSGLRTKQRNAEVGGAENSAHLTGHAVDIAASSSAQRFAIVNAALAVGFKRVGIAKTFVHLDTHPTHPQPSIWLY